MAEPLEIGVARPEIAGVDEVVLVGADPQLLRPGARLDLLKRGDDAGLEDVEPAGDMKAGDVGIEPRIGSAGFGSQARA